MIIANKSAADFWINSNPEKTIGYNLQTRNLVDFPDNFTTEYRVDRAELRILSKELNIPLPIHILSPSINHKSHTNIYISHFQNIIPKKQSLIRLRSFNDTFIASPELSFLQFAKDHDLIETIQFGDMLCSLFCHDSVSRFNQISRNPLTTPKLLKEFILNSPCRVHGIKNARKAINYITAFANSPAEINLGIFISLPVDMGGFGLPEFEMNYPIQLSDYGFMLMHVNELRGDIVWKNDLVVIEYNSDMLHSDTHQMALDSNRSAAMQDQDYKVFSITTEDTRSLNRLEEKLTIVRIALGLSPEILNKYKRERQTLYKQLFSSRAF